MFGRAATPTTQDLRRLARRVSRNGIGGARLGLYLRRLMEWEHLEMSAGCRLEVIRHCAEWHDLPPKALARTLHRHARSMERAAASDPHWNRWRLARWVVAAASAAGFVYGLEEMFAWRGGVAEMAVGAWLFLISLPTSGEPSRLETHVRRAVQEG